MGTFGTFDPNRDPMRNAALSAQFSDYENKRNAFYNMLDADPAFCL